MVQTAIAKQKAPADDFLNMIDIEKYFNEHILDQSTSIRNLSVAISKVLHNSRFLTQGDESEEDSSLLHTIILAGPIGTGKSATVKCLRHLLGMDDGYENETLFIEIDVTSCTDNNTIQKDSVSLIDRLNRAIGSHADKEPPYVMIFIDDYHHTSQAFRLLLTKLMEKGQYKASESKHFSLPKHTALLVVCTSHYGSEEIIKMDEQCDDNAKRFISRAMQHDGTTIQNHNLLLPYYPLGDETLRQLLGQKLDNYINSSRIQKRAGVEVLKSTPEMKHTLIEHVLTRVDRRCGMQDGERMLKDKLNVFFETGFAVIDKMREGLGADTVAPVFLDSYTFDTRLFGEILDKELERVTGDLIRTIRENPQNKQYLAKCDPHLNGRVEALSMRYGKEPVCGVIMNVTYINVNNYYDIDETTKVLKDKNKKLKACIMAINAVVDRKDSRHTIDDIIKNHHELLNESSDDSGEERRRHKRKAPLLSARGIGTDLEQQQQKKLKMTHPAVSEEEEEEEESSSVESSSSSSSSITEDEEERVERLTREIDIFLSSDEEEEDLFSDSGDMELDELLNSDNEAEYITPIPKKRGRPKKCLDGFERSDLNSKNPYYVCLTCRAKLSKLCYAQRHHCKKNPVK